MTSKKGFAANPEFAREMALKYGALGGAKSKGRKLTPEHKAKLSEARRRTLEKRKPEQLEA